MQTTATNRNTISFQASCPTVWHINMQSNNYMVEIVSSRAPSANSSKKAHYLYNIMMEGNNRSYASRSCKAQVD